MKRYLPSIKKYLWIAVVCTVLAAILGFLVVKEAPQAYVGSATLLVNATAPDTTVGGNSASASDSITQASNYAAEIPTQVIMEYVFKADPRIKARGFTVNDMMADVVALMPNPTASTIQIEATALKPSDALLLANDVANGYEAFKTQQLQTQLNTERTYYTNEYKSYQAQSNSLYAQILSYGSSSDPHIALLTSNRSQIMTLMNQVQQQMDSLPPTVHSDIFILSLATPNSIATTAKSSLIIGVAALIGLILGFLIMLLMIFIDDRLRGGDMVPEKLGMNYLGSLSTNAEVKAGTIPTTGQFAQQVADIGVNLRLTNVLPGTWHAPQGNVLLVTSAQIAEGKTTTVAALAGSLARGGYSVLVIDGDVHNPATHLAFGITPASFGLSGLLKSTGAENLDAAVQRTNMPGVWLLAGGSPTEEGTILLEQKMPAILAQLRKRTDIILIDSPALLSSADASILATLVDGIAMVVDFRYDKIKLLLRARDILRSVAQKPMGVIINHMPKQKRNPYYTVTYIPDEAATNYAGAQTYSSNGNGHDTGNGQRLEPSSSPNYNAFSVPSSPSRPTPAPAMPMDFPVMQSNPNPPSTFPSPRRMDMTPPQS